MDLDEFDEVPPYEEWTWNELRAEAKARGLEAMGTRRDLADRLWADDEENPDEPETVQEPEPETTTEPEPEPLSEPEPHAKAEPVSPAEPVQAAGQAPLEPRSHTLRREYPLPAEGFTDEFHRESLMRIYSEAVNAGLTPKGGPYGANRVGWGDLNGVKTAVYESLVG